MLKVFYGNDNKAIYSEVSGMKSGYDHVAVFNEYTDLKAAASEITMKNVFQTGRKLVILYNLSTSMTWLLNLLPNIKNDIVLVFSGVDKRSKVWGLIKQNKPKEFKIKSNSIFEYIDKIFGEGIFQGVMSDEIPQEAVIKHPDGYDRVDYSKIDVEFKRI